MDQLLAVLGFFLIAGGFTFLFLNGWNRASKVAARIALVTIILGSILILWRF